MSGQGAPQVRARAVMDGAWMCVLRGEADPLRAARSGGCGLCFDAVEHRQDQWRQCRIINLRANADLAAIEKGIDNRIRMRLAQFGMQPFSVRIA